MEQWNKMILSCVVDRKTLFHCDFKKWNKKSSMILTRMVDRKIVFHFFRTKWNKVFLDVIICFFGVKYYWLTLRERYDNILLKRGGSLVIRLSNKSRDILMFWLLFCLYS